MAEKEPLESVTHMPHDVKAIDDLHRLWGSTPHALGIWATSIATDALATWMGLKPWRDGGNRALGQQLNDLMAFKIPDNSAEASASPPRPCIEPNHPWDRKGREGRPMDQTHHRPATPRYAWGVREPRAGTAANGQAHVA
jgi:hypothetical protein